MYLKGYNKGAILSIFLIYSINILVDYKADLYYKESVIYKREFPKVVC